MSRLAAYYQEDFHIHPFNQGPKQRKSAYVFYEEPRNNYSLNGGRLRNLATSEPELSPLSNACKPDKMTFKHKPVMYGNPQIEHCHPPMQYLDNDHNVHFNNQFARMQREVYDNEACLYADDRALYDDRYIQRYKHMPKDKNHKRFSYVEPRNNNYSSELCLPQNFNRFNQTPLVYDNPYQLPPDQCYYEPSQDSPRSPPYYQNGSKYENWQQWPLPPGTTFLNHSLLSPPSPLDSGLSSQSITSSPSLEADSFPIHTEPMGIGRSDQVCSCPKVHYSESKSHGPSLSRHDSGRSSGVYSAYRFPKESHRLKNGSKHVPKAREEYNYCYPQNGQVRYGKLGIVGEFTNHNGSVNGTLKKKHEHLQRQDKFDKIDESRYEVENGISHRRPSSRASNSHQHLPKFKKPFLVITEASEKSLESDDAGSPDRNNSDKNEESESSSSANVSRSSSKSSSVSSSSNDLNCNRKQRRTGEKDIRELEDLYEKCNLSDDDLFDRAERRDLPTAHQTKRDQAAPRLKRSKSDTLYETISPSFRNPYETPQRAPPLRRSGLPDRIADDMALRKLQKSTTRSSNQGAKNTLSYMLCNSHFTPTVRDCKDILLMDYPDVEFDDLSFRKHYFGKKSKIPDPQPPFGIPLRPPPPQKVYSDYLHLVPSNCPQPLCHPRGNPDVVRDDLAFRALRKDEPERIYYDISQLYKMSKR